VIAGLTRRFADRNRLPRAVNIAIDYIADHPTSLPGRIAARRKGRPDKSITTPVTTFENKPTRLLIAPVNYSGQGREWARSLELADETISARNMAVDVPGGFSFDADLVVPVPVYTNDTRWQTRQFEAVSSHATHVLVEAEEPLFGRLMGRDVRRQVVALIDRGVNVAFIAHGTDIRLPSRHIARTPWSLYKDPSVYVPRLESLARRNRELLDDLHRRVFVSTPDLLADVEDGIWCPVVVEPSKWGSAARTTSDGAPLRVVHAPSASTLKGTPLIEPLLERLETEGVISYRRVTGAPAALMPALFGEADVLIDQFRAGSYGVAACEAMAGGCIAIGHVLADVRRTVMEVSGLPLPVVEATPDTLEEVLRGLATDHRKRHAVSLASIDFVHRVHDGRLSASILRDHWLSPAQA
jgi:hypothetical protein